MNLPAPLSYSAYQARGYLPELDGLRALSVLLVVSVHMHDASTMWRWLAGAQGVTVFFVLSGYLISALALREERERGRVSLSAFYVRRSFRIFPSYYAVLGLYCLLIFSLGLGGAQAGTTMSDALPWYLFYLQEVPFFSWLVIQQIDVPFFQSWSLGIEEKFYLVWPVFAFVACLGRPRCRQVGAVILAAVFALIPGALLLVDPSSKVLGRCLFSYHPILVGCVLALLLDDPKWYGRLQWLGQPRMAALAGGLFLAVHFLTPWVPTLPLPHGWHIVYSLTTALLLAGILLGGGWLGWLLSRPVLVAVGRLSYGTYLVHLLGIGLAHRLADAVVPSPWNGVAAYLFACVLSVAAAWVLSLLIERPCIELGRRLSGKILRRQARSAAPADPAESTADRGRSRRELAPRLVMEKVG